MLTRICWFKFHTQPLTSDGQGLTNPDWFNQLACTFLSLKCASCSAEVGTKMNQKLLRSKTGLMELAMFIGRFPFFSHGPFNPSSWNEDQKNNKIQKIYKQVKPKTL